MIALQLSNAGIIQPDLISFSPMPKLQFGTIRTQYNMSKSFDYGQISDYYATTIEILVTNSQYNILFQNIDDPDYSDIHELQISTDHDLFFPNRIFSGTLLTSPFNMIDGGYCTILEMRNDGYYDDLHTLRKITLTIKWNDTEILSGDYSSDIQSFLNSAKVTPLDDFGLNGFNAVGSGGYQPKKQKLNEILLSNDFVSPFEANRILSFFKINRSTELPLTLSNRHFGFSGVKSCVLYDLYLERLSFGRYSVSFYVSIGK